MSDELDFSDENFMWKLYTKYTHIYSQKSENNDKLLTPGTFCDYFAINWQRAVEAGKPRNMETCLEIIEEKLSDVECEYSENPCMYPECMKIYNDKDGDRNYILSWQH